MLCLGAVRIGPARQVFWAVWDRGRQRLHQRTTVGHGAVELGLGRARVHDHGLRLDLQLEEESGIETVCAAGSAYGWTRKQGGVAAAGVLTLHGGPRRVFTGRAVIDDTAAYYPRHTRWRWCAGVGESRDGRSVAWNLVAGVNDPPRGSERTVWVDGAADEVPPSRFAPDLSAVDDLRFAAEATRERRENLLIVRSRYRQPFGTFAGVLPGGTELGHGYGVMEEHDVRW